MTGPFPSPGELVDERSNKLIDEFNDHFDECAESFVQQGIEPDLESVDRERVFQGWAIQKIAGMQLVIEDLLRWREREIEDRY